VLHHGALTHDRSVLLGDFLFFNFVCRWLSSTRVPLVGSRAWLGLDIEGVPPRSVVLMPYEKPGLDIHDILAIYLGRFVLARVYLREGVVDVPVDVTCAKQVVTLEFVLLIAPRVGLISVQLAVHEDQFLSLREKVALRPHT
jgi:hypothetical protein